MSQTSQTNPCRKANRTFRRCLLPLDPSLVAIMCSIKPTVISAGVTTPWCLRSSASANSIQFEYFVPSQIALWYSSIMSATFLACSARSLICCATLRWTAGSVLLSMSIASRSSFDRPSTRVDCSLPQTRQIRTLRVPFPSYGCSWGCPQSCSTITSCLPPIHRQDEAGGVLRG